MDKPARFVVKKIQKLRLAEVRKLSDLRMEFEKTFGKDSNLSLLEDVLKHLEMEEYLKKSYALPSRSVRRHFLKTMIRK